jgi:glycosyltransferase involved in cell wall biosynthesis
VDVVVTCEFRFYRSPDGRIWTNSVFMYPFWSRYLAVFSKVIVIARIQDVSSVDDTWQLSDGENVTFVALPYYIGLVGLLKNMFAIRKVIRAECVNDRALIFRVPSQSAMLALLGTGHSIGYALEVVGDPYDVFSSGITSRSLDKILAYLSYLGLRRMAKNALAACYVTSRYLQRRYPVKDSQISVGCSDIELHNSHFVSQPRSYQTPVTKLVFVGSLEQLYKGPDTLINAISLLKNQGHLFDVTLLGGGQFLEAMQQLAINLKCAELFNFVGAVSHADVAMHLAQNELFVMPSKTEGLPRALLEAMAKGLPCIASNVGGIPELLDEQYLVEKNNPQQLAAKILSLSQSTLLLSAASKRNLAKAQEYEISILHQRRHAFYQSYFNLQEKFNENSPSS